MANSETPSLPCTNADLQELVVDVLSDNPLTKVEEPKSAGLEATVGNAAPAKAEKKEKKKEAKKVKKEAKIASKQLE